MKEFFANKIINDAALKIVNHMVDIIKKAYRVANGTDPNYDNDEYYGLEFEGVCIKVEDEDRQIEEIRIDRNGTLYFKLVDGDEYDWDEISIVELRGISNIIDNEYHYA